MDAVETYLKTQQVADALGVSVSTVKRWVDSGAIEATRTMGKHRLVALSSALKFARQEKFPVDPLLAIDGSPLTFVVDERLIDRFVDALKQGRISEVREIIRRTCELKHGSVVLADQLVRPSMERIGNGWMLGNWQIYEEHQASLVIASLIQDQIRGYEKIEETGRPLAIGATPDGDPYQLPVLLGELVLREVGWEVKNFGSNLPLRSLAKATREYRPRLIFLATSVIADVAGFVRDYAYFYEAASQVGAAIILGGRGLDHQLRSQLVYASFGERMIHLAEFARRLLPGSMNQLDAASNQPGPMNSQS